MTDKTPTPQSSEDPVVDNGMDRVRDLVEVYGADPQRWPDTVPDKIKVLAQSNRDTLERSMTDTASLDALLEALPTPHPAPSLARRILETAPEPGSQRVSRARIADAVGALLARWIGTGEAIPAGAAVASFAIGLVIGLSFPTAGTMPSPEEEEAVLFAALGVGDLFAPGVEE